MKIGDNITGILMISLDGGNLLNILDGAAADAAASSPSGNPAADFTLVNADGQVIASTAGQSGTAGSSMPDEAVNLVLGGGLDSGRFIGSSGTDVLMAWTGIEVMGGRASWALVAWTEAGSSMAAIRPGAIKLILISVLFLFLSAAAAAFYARRLNNQLSTVKTRHEEEQTLMKSRLEDQRNTLRILNDRRTETGVRLFDSGREMAGQVERLINWIRDLESSQRLRDDEFRCMIEIIESLSAAAVEAGQQTVSRHDAPGFGKEHLTPGTNAPESGESGGETREGSLDQLVTTMDEIRESSRNISGIVKTIEDISWQINLLSLNANIEAARAGKYGRGFGVVAEEVRNLANSSATSVKETNDQVQSIEELINRAAGLVGSLHNELRDTGIADGATGTEGSGRRDGSATARVSASMENSIEELKNIAGRINPGGAMDAAAGNDIADRLASALETVWDLLKGSAPREIEDRRNGRS